jgi:hypothetical protein
MMNPNFFQILGNNGLKLLLLNFMNSNIAVKKPRKLPIVFTINAQSLKLSLNVMISRKESFNRLKLY